MSWKVIDERSSGIESIAFWLYQGWFASQGHMPPFLWEELVQTDKDRFVDAAVNGLCGVFESVYDAEIDEPDNEHEPGPP